MESMSALGIYTLFIYLERLRFYSAENLLLHRYFLRFTIARSFSSNIIKEQDIWVHNYQTLPSMNNSIKMEVGIEDCLHIEFEYNRSKYDFGYCDKNWWC